MSQQDSNVTYTVVAFRYNRKRSVLYRTNPIPEEIALSVKHALERLDADIISIRRVYVKNPLEG